MSVDLNQVAEDMFKMVEKDHGTKKYKPGDLFKAMVTKYKSEDLSKKDCKSAIRILIDSERLNYTYFNGTFVEIPGIEGAAMAAEAAAHHG
jgi:pyruvoyl-dependent arginine decarboxylase (PvlArgDC)